MIILPSAEAALKTTVDPPRFVIFVHRVVEAKSLRDQLQGFAHPQDPLWSEFDPVQRGPRISNVLELDPYTVPGKLTRTVQIKVFRGVATMEPVMVPTLSPVRIVSFCLIGTLLHGHVGKTTSGYPNPVQPDHVVGYAEGGKSNSAIGNFSIRSAL